MTHQRLHIRISGAVQGVGFRPFLYRLLTENHLSGNIRNFTGGVELDAEGEATTLQSLLLCIQLEKPPLARIFGLEPRWLPPLGLTGITLLPSLHEDSPVGVILPDIATCPDCLREIFDPSARRFGYPFTNCTNCGPRYTIIKALPYDRGATSMSPFIMCEDCRREYEDPTNRRFHAQPIACPSCGPALQAYTPTGQLLLSGRDKQTTDDILAQAVTRLQRGGIVALMGLGGIQLLTRADNQNAVTRLRHLKARDAKPFAIMVKNLASATQLANISPLEARLLTSPEAPIVLLTPTTRTILAPSVSSCSPWLGVMLPSTPLHHLLLSMIDCPLVVTSGNLSHEPICTTHDQAFTKLGDIADLFILHDRPILRPVDDSVVRIVCGKELVLRRARGYAPMPVHHLTHTQEQVILATGAQMKNALAWHLNGQNILSQHLGDLDTLEAMQAWEHTLVDTQSLLRTTPDIIAVDGHPDYISTRRGEAIAHQLGIPCQPVQHHIAHVLACMEENETPFPAMGVAWDGTGYGTDGTIWGGEWFDMRHDGWTRIGHLATFCLPGGDLAVKEPRRIALSLLLSLPAHECPILRQRLASAFDATSLQTCRQMIERKINCPTTTSMGRLFDAIAFFLGFNGAIRCEGEASMWLESQALRHETSPYTQHKTSTNNLFHINTLDDGTFIIDWAPCLHALELSLQQSQSISQMAWEFHDKLAQIIVTTAHLSGNINIAVGGGCFQNALLLERLEENAKNAPSPLCINIPQRVPPNDGGIALGQISALIHHYPPFSPLSPLSTHVSGSPR
ncbi:MAG: carbamoyltransferase HypF [Akkermansia sp.]